MNRNWEKDLQDKEKAEFYNWLHTWSKEYEKQPRIINTKLSRPSSDLEPGDRITVWINPYINEQHPSILCIDEQIVFIYGDKLNSEFDILKPLFKIPTNQQVVGFIISMYILNYDLTNKTDSSKWFLNSFSSVKNQKKPLITLKELLEVWDSIQELFWAFRYRFHVIQDLIYSTLLTVKQNISYTIIPPNWILLDKRELDPVSPDNAVVLEQFALNHMDELIYGISEKRKKELINQLREEINKKYLEDIELLKKEFPNQYDTINQMVKKGESIEVIKSFLKHIDKEEILKHIDKKIENRNQESSSRSINNFSDESKSSPKTPIQTSQETSKKKPTIGEINKSRIQGLAEEHWKHQKMSGNPLTPIHILCEDGAFKKIAKRNRPHKKEPYSTRTIKKWIREVAPQELLNRRGRPKKKN